MDPDGPAVDEQRPGRAQRVAICAPDLGGETDHVDDDIAPERDNPLPERPGRVLRVTVHLIRSTALHSGAREYGSRLPRLIATTS